MSIRGPLRLFIQRNLNLLNFMKKNVIFIHFSKKKIRKNIFLQISNAGLDPLWKELSENVYICYLKINKVYILKKICK